MSRKEWSWKSFYERLDSFDPDLRQMALFDLHRELERDTFSLGSDDDKATRALLKCFTASEANSEVQSNAVRAVQLFVPRCESRSRTKLLSQLCSNMHAKLDCPSDRHQMIRDNAALALKMILAALPVEMTDAVDVIARELSAGLGAATEAKMRMDLFDVVTDVCKRFGPKITAFHEAIAAAATKDLTASTPQLRKRASACLATLSRDCNDARFEQTMKLCVDGLAGAKGEALRRQVQHCTAISRAAGDRFAVWVAKVAPLLLKELDRLEELEDEDERESMEADETRENILLAFENFFAHCPGTVTELLSAMVKHASELLKWDPNYGYDGDEGEEEEDDDDDDMLDDSGDTSWKVRKSAGRCLLQAIRSRPDQLALFLGVLVTPGSPLLVQRFTERIENVRLEVLEVFRALVEGCAVRQRGAVMIASRGSYEGSFRHVDIEVKPESAMMVQVRDRIVGGLVRCTKHKSVKVKAAAFMLLHELFVLIGPQLGADIPRCVDAVVACLADPRLATPHLRPEVLAFARTLVPAAVTLLSRDAQLTGLLGKLKDVLPPVLACTEDKYFRTVVAALLVCDELVALVRMAPQEKALASSLFKSLFARLSTGDADQDVRKAALGATAKLIKYAGASLAAEDVHKAYDCMLSLLRNEATRISAARAVRVVQRCKLPAATVQQVAAELAGFLRKTDRQVREEGLRTLTTFVPSHAATIDAQTLTAIVTELSLTDGTNLLCERELFLASLGLQLGKAVAAAPGQGKAVLEKLVPRVLQLLANPLTQGQAVKEAADFFAAVVRSPGMALAGLTDVVLAAVKAAPVAVVSNVAVAAGVVIALDTDSARRNKCLKDLCGQAGSSVAAIACLGEVARSTDVAGAGVLEALRKALESGQEDAKLAAANALGRAASADASGSVFPALVAGAVAGQPAQYHHLVALRAAFAARAVESGAATPAMEQQRSAVIEALLGAGEGAAEDVVIEVASEALGRYCQVDSTVVVDLAKRVDAATPAAKATALLALRYTLGTHTTPQLAEAVAAHLDVFLPYIDKAAAPDLRVRRGGLQLLLAVAANRPTLLFTERARVGYFPSLLAETAVDASLVTSVDLGPFKHVVDKGLDVRKQAFECLAAFMDETSRGQSLADYMAHHERLAQCLVRSISLKEENDADINAIARTLLVKLAQSTSGAAHVTAHVDAVCVALKVPDMEKTGLDGDKTAAIVSAITAALRLQTIPAFAASDKFKTLLASCMKSPYSAAAQKNARLE